jgi:hypothetical protein
MNCWGIRIYFTRSRFSLNEGYIVYMELLSGHEKIITKSAISLNAGTLNRGFTVFRDTICTCIGQVTSGTVSTCACSFKRGSKKRGPEFLSKMFTNDKTWVYRYSPEIKDSAMMQAKLWNALAEFQRTSQNAPNCGMINGLAV